MVNLLTNISSALEWPSKRTLDPLYCQHFGDNYKDNDVSEKTHQLSTNILLLCVTSNVYPLSHLYDDNGISMALYKLYIYFLNKLALYKEYQKLNVCIINVR